MIFSIQIMFLFGLITRASGGGIVRLHNNISFLPELLFGVLLGAAVYFNGHALIWSFACAAWSYAWLESGHGTALHMGDLPSTAMNGRKQFLSPVVDLLTCAAGQGLGSRFYCWTLFSIKGALIGAPLGLYGLMLAVLWPLSYQLGQLFSRNWLWFGSAFKEFLSGACAGFVIFLYVCY